MSENWNNKILLILKNEITMWYIVVLNQVLNLGRSFMTPAFLGRRQPGAARALGIFLFFFFWLPCSMTLKTIENMPRLEAKMMENHGKGKNCQRIPSGKLT